MFGANCLDIKKNTVEKGTKAITDDVMAKHQNNQFRKSRRRKGPVWTQVPPVGGHLVLIGVCWEDTLRKEFTIYSPIVKNALQNNQTMLERTTEKVNYKDDDN